MILVQQVSVILYKKMGIPNEQIALWTSLIAWPWILKLLWGPLVDLYGKKRNWVLTMQVLISLGLVAIGIAMSSESFLPMTLAVFVMLAFFSATHDIALDAYYLAALPQDRHAFFIGIRSTAFRTAMIFGTGGLVVFAGKLELQGVAIAQSWQYAFWIGAALYALLMVYATQMMPRLGHDGALSKNTTTTGEAVGFKEAIGSFFNQPKIVPILFFILLYRFGESMLSKISSLFLLDPRTAGGLGFSTIEVGMIMGNVGVLSLVCGGLLGGFAIARFGLRACIWPMVAAMNLPNLLYIWAAATQPGPESLYAIISLDQFGYGFGLASYMVYAMYLCQKSRFQASHYAIVTALMALGAMIAGIVSGYLLKFLGYYWFFCAVCMCTIPGVILLRLIPLDRVEDSYEPALAED